MFLISCNSTSVGGVCIIPLFFLIINKSGRVRPCKGWMFVIFTLISLLGSQEYIESLLSKIAFREGIGEVLAQGLEKAPKLLPEGVEESQKAGFLENPAYFDPYGPRYHMLILSI